MGSDGLMEAGEKLYAIREVSELTGVKPVTLRAWQRRYHLLQPMRTDKGHRLYREQDFQRIEQILHWLAKGISIGKVSELIHQSEPAGRESILPLLEECEVLLTALAQLNRGKAEATVISVFKNYPLAIAETQFIVPVNDTLNRMKGPLRSVQKGLFQSLMITQFSWLITSANKASHHGKCLCVSLDPVGSLWAWLQATKIAEQGYYAVLLDGVDDLSGLAEPLSLASYRKIDFFSNKALTEKQQQTIRQIDTFFDGETSYSGMLQQLYPDYRNTGFKV
jgi:DNA-binding transcriptional MerR regulator